MAGESPAAFAHLSERVKLQDNNMNEHNNSIMDKIHCSTTIVGYLVYKYTSTFLNGPD